MKRVRPARSERVLVDYFIARGLNPNLFTVADMVDATLGFYAAIRASSIPRRVASDMMLFEWGTFDWGRGEFFQVSLARQFTENRIFGGYLRMSQLHAVAYFSPDEELSVLGRNHFWCDDIEDLREFREAVLSSKAYEGTKDITPHRAEIWWELI